MSVYLGANSIISPLAFSTTENFNSILSGKKALTDTKFDFSEKPFFTAVIAEEKLDNSFSPFKNEVVYTKLEKMCILAIEDVLHQSAVDLARPDSLLIISTTKGNVDLLSAPQNPETRGREYLSAMANTIGEFFKCKNSPLVVSNACISGLLAIIMAERFIKNKKYRHIIVCGADLVTEFTLSGFRSFNAISDIACKPFDKNRTGINLGECASAILLSSEPLSKVIISAGASANDANHISGPSRTGDGLFQAVSQTIAGKKIPDFISAHGTATEYNDEMESAAFFRAGLNHLPVNSLKGYYGHTLGAAGVLETVLSIESLKQNLLIRSEGYETQGTTHLDHVIMKNTNKELVTCLKTASGFGGCNAAALFEKI